MCLSLLLLLCTEYCRRVFTLPSKQPVGLVFPEAILDLSHSHVNRLIWEQDMFWSKVSEWVLGVRLVPVQGRGGLAETHVCNLETLLCFGDQLCHSASLIIIPIIILLIIIILFLFSLQSTQWRLSVAALIRPPSTGCSSCSHPTTGSS